MLSATKVIKRKTFNRLVYEEGKDVFLFTYSTATEDETYLFIILNIV